jgi:hypothetical protein
MGDEVCKTPGCGRPHHAKGWCSRCYARDYQRRWRLENPESVNASKRKHRAANPEQYRETVRKWRQRHPDMVVDHALRKNHGITLEEWDRILESQGGHCAVCDRRCEDDGRRLSVDHDHATGKIRGILCSRHNIALGQCEDESAQLAALAAYAAKWEKRNG